MKQSNVLFCAWSIFFGILIPPAPCHATHQVDGRAEVRIVILSSREAPQEDASVKSFRATEAHAEFRPKFQRINDAGLRGEWYLAKQIPFGEYEVRLSIGSGKSDIVRVVGIESRSETLYFSSDMTTAHIIAVDPLGGILKNIVVDKVVDSFGTDYAQAFGSTSSATLPSGIYQVQVHARSYGITTGEFCFCQAESWSVLGVGIPGGDSVYPDATVRLKGSLQGGPSVNEPIIVRLSPAYMASSMAAVISPGSNDRFEVSGVLPAAGDYVLLVSQAGHILGNGVIRLPLRNTVSLMLETGATISLETEGQRTTDSPEKPTQIQ